VFVLEGRIDSEGAVNLDQAIQEAAAQGRRNMVVDMAEVRYLNSAGLHTLARALAANRERGGDLRIVALNPIIRQVFQIVGFDRYFPVYDRFDIPLAGD
jgi:anti-sigma B factor antagonist